MSLPRQQSTRLQHTPRTEPCSVAGQVVTPQAARGSGRTPSLFTPPQPDSVSTPLQPQHQLCEARGQQQQPQPALLPSVTHRACDAEVGTCTPNYSKAKRCLLFDQPYTAPAWDHVSTELQSKLIGRSSFWRSEQYNSANALDESYTLMNPGKRLASTPCLPWKMPSVNAASRYTGRAPSS